MGYSLKNHKVKRVMTFSGVQFLLAAAVLLLPACAFTEDTLWPTLTGESPKGTNKHAAAAPQGAATSGQVGGQSVIVVQTPPPLGNTNFQPTGVTPGQPTGTFVGQKVGELRSEVKRLQGSVSPHHGPLQGLRGKIGANSQRYHGTIAAVNARLQVGTTPGNPILVQQFNSAQGDLDRIATDITEMNTLAARVSNNSTMSSFLLESAKASFAVSGYRAVTQEQRGALELVVCYRLDTGHIIWSHSDSVRFENVLGGIGPRATPTISGGRVYTMGATGILNCLELADGREIWSVEVLKGSSCPNQEWGKSSSPLLAGELVVVTGGGGKCPGLLAYDRKNGEETWRSAPSELGYSSPALATIAGTPQILLLNYNTVTANDPSNGGVLWSHPWPGGNPKVTQPVPVSEDRILVSSGYGVGAELFEVQRDERGAFTTNSIWKNRNLKSKFANIVIHEENAYGLDDGIMVCINLQTGKRRWKGGRYGHGQLLLAGNILLVMAERGEMALVRPDPGGLRELSRVRMIEGKSWNHPALAPPYLLVRNAREAACYKLQGGGG